eukprot:1543953-Prymnesium_polylepis.1
MSRRGRGSVLDAARWSMVSPPLCPSVSRVSELRSIRYRQGLYSLGRTTSTHHSRTGLLIPTLRMPQIINTTQCVYSTARGPAVSVARPRR